MGAIVPFVFKHDQNETPIRTLLIEGEPWFVAADACAALELEMRSGILRRLQTNEKGAYPIWTPGGMQQMTIINRDGLIRLVMRSDKPQALIFQNWIITEVIPAILDTGIYALPIAAAEQPDLHVALDSMKRELISRLDRIDGKLGSTRFAEATKRRTCEATAKHNNGRCWYCNETVVVDQYGVMIPGKADFHHANGNHADLRQENCMLACKPKQCHDRLTHPSRKDHIPADKALAKAIVFWDRANQIQAQIRAPEMPADVWDFRPQHQTDFGFRALSAPTNWKRQKKRR